MDKDPAHVDLLELVEKMLEYAPEQRITLREALRHPFFTPCKREMRAQALMSSFDEPDTTTTTNNESLAPASLLQPVAEPLTSTNTDLSFHPLTTPPSSLSSSVSSQLLSEKASPLEKGLDNISIPRGIAVVKPFQEKDISLKEDVGFDKGPFSPRTAGGSNKWVGLPAANFTLETLNFSAPALTQKKARVSRLEDCNILERLEKAAAAVKESAAQIAADTGVANLGVMADEPNKSLKSLQIDPSVEANKGGASKIGTRPRIDSKGEAPVKARRRRRESKQLREKTPPLSSLVSAQTPSLESNPSGDEGIESLALCEPEGVQFIKQPETLPAKLLMETQEDAKDSGQKKILQPLKPITTKPLAFSAMAMIELTPASPQGQDPPEIMESLGMGHFFNQGTQTPERFYREMCPSPHEFSNQPPRTMEKGTQTPIQFYPPIPTQDVAIDAGQFPDAMSSSYHSLDNSISEEPSEEKFDNVFENEPVSLLETPKLCFVAPSAEVKSVGGIVLTAIPEKVHLKANTTCAPEVAVLKEQTPPPVVVSHWQTECTVDLPSPLCILLNPPDPQQLKSENHSISDSCASSYLPALSIHSTASMLVPTTTTTITTNLTTTPVHTLPSEPAPSQKPSETIKAATQQAFEAWIKTQSPYEEVSGVSVAPATQQSNILMPTAIAAVPHTSPLPAVPAAATSQVVVEGTTDGKARPKKRRERRRRPGPQSESSIDSTPPSTPSLVSTSDSVPGDSRLSSEDQAKKKAPQSIVNVCEGKGSNPVSMKEGIGENHFTGMGNNSGMVTNLQSERSTDGEGKRQDFIKANNNSQFSDTDEFVLASESLDVEKR